MSSYTENAAPAPLTDQERQLLIRMFSDFFEVPGEWKTSLVSYLEANPPILGTQTLGGQGGAQGPPGAVGPPGPGVPGGGASATVLTKASAADYDTVWAASSGSGGSGGNLDGGGPASVYGGLALVDGGTP